MGVWKDAGFSAVGESFEDDGLRVRPEGFDVFSPGREGERRETECSVFFGAGKGARIRESRRGRAVRRPNRCEPGERGSAAAESGDVGHLSSG